MRTGILLLLGLIACGDDASPQLPDGAGNPDAAIDGAVDVDAPDGPLGDILDELQAIPGLTVEERDTMHEGYRFFVMTYDQPVDHDDPGGARFPQRMTLLHRDYAAPVIAHNSGYNVSTRGNRSQLTVLVNGNQLSMEHRYQL